MAQINVYEPVKDAVKGFSGRNKQAEKALDKARTTLTEGRRKLANEKKLFQARNTDEQVAAFEYGEMHGRAGAELDNVARTVPGAETHAPLKGIYSKQRYPTKAVEAATTRAENALNAATLAGDMFEKMMKEMDKFQRQAFDDDSVLPRYSRW